MARKTKKISKKKPVKRKATKKKVLRKPTKKKVAKKVIKKISRKSKTKAQKSNSSWIPGHPHPEPKVKRIRTAKGRRPYFFDDPNIDKLLAMIMALTGEVSVLRERLDTHERLAQKKKWASHQSIEDYEPDDITEAFRAQWRSEFIARVLRIVQVELDQITREKQDKEYDEIVKEVSKE